jgi:aminopeptidase N
MKLTTNYLSDYTPPAFAIQSIYLTIELYDTKTIITSELAMNKTGDSDELTLHGENQTLLSIQLNKQPLDKNQYHLDNETLTIKHVPTLFELIIQSEIKPHENTSLSGLYQSGALFCTQCEPEGFRRITYYLDRPDIMALFTTKIIANKKNFPVLLSNGNCIAKGELDNHRHFAVWHDPFKKPAYLFAMVAGQLNYVEDFFKTQSGRTITLRIYAEKGYQEKCRYALTSIKKAMRWDEEHYGREYDLDIFMIVAVHDFNFGAMENKGLNIFNAKYIFVDSNAATDADYFGVDRVVAHEYFHNWTGDRVTLRDWFQICLKEGLTSFREQTFSEDISSTSVARIDEVELLRSHQFPEDAGPLAHPIRPESYVEIDNFYTMTVYEKGAEVIRMLKNIVGDINYRQGTDLYFERYDGQAVTCEDFLRCMEDSSSIDLSQFRLWYSEAGTPVLSIQSTYDENKKQFALTVEQKYKKAMLIPFKLGLINHNGHEVLNKTLLLTRPKETLIFDNIESKPTPSLLRDFSAPVKIEYDYSDKELLMLILHDKNGFAAWEAMQIYLSRKILSDDAITEDIFVLFKKIINTPVDLALTARLLTLPSEKYLGEQTVVVNIDALHESRTKYRHHIARHLSDDLMKHYHALNDQRPFCYSNEESAKRSLKNTCLHYLCLDGHADLAFEQFKIANNMTDKIAALSALSQTESDHYHVALAQFYDEYSQEPLIIDKWFAIQASSPLPDTLNTVKTLVNHADFNFTNPNRVRSLLGAFSQNQVRFHIISGEGYQLLMDYVLTIDPLNPMLASRLIEPFTRWQRYDEKRQALMKTQLQRAKKTTTLSKNLIELVEKSIPINKI